MGILSKITSTNKSSTGLTTGGHAIDKTRVLQPTDPTVINPTNPGSWESIRSVPVVPHPREFNREEYQALKEIAKQKTAAARETQKAYRALSRIEQADAIVHKSHRKYQGKVADAELVKIRSNASLAKHLHAIRPQYAQLDSSIDRAEQAAQQRIEQLKAKINGIHG